MDHARCQNLEFLRSVLDAIPSMLFVVDHDVRILHMNSAAARFIGSEAKSGHLRRGGDLLHCIHAADSPEGCGRGPACGSCVIRTSVNKARTGTHVSGERTIMTLAGPDGTLQTVHLQVTTAPFLDSDGTVLLILENVTELSSALEKARESEERYKAIVDNQAEFVCRYLPGGIITFVNDTLCRYTGMTREDLLGKSFYPFIYHEDRPEFISSIESLDKDHPSVVAEARVQLPGGPLTWHNWTHHAIFDSADRLTEYQCTGRDITDRRQAEESLLRERNFSNAIIDSLPGIFYIFDERGTVLKWNENIKHLLGYTKEEIAVRNIREYFADEDRQLIEQAMRSVFETGHQTIEATVITNDGRRIPYFLTGTRYLIDDRHYILGMGIDISERRRAEERIRESEQRYRALYSLSPDGVLLIDTDGRIVEFNDSAHSQLGYTREEFAKLTVADIDPFETPEQVKNSIDRVLRDGRADFEVRHRTKSGEIRNVLVITQAIRISGSAFFHSIWRDITESKRFEEALKESENKFRNLFESANDALFIIDMKGSFLDVNGAAYRRLGYTKEELLAIPLSHLDHPSFAPLIRERFRELRELGQTVFESAHIRKDGTIMPVEINARLIDLKGQQAVFSVIRDITGRKRAEEALRASEAKLRNITSVIGEGIYALDAQGRLMFMNPEAERLLGWTEAELLGRQIHEIIHFQKADGKHYAAEVCPSLKTITSGEVLRNEEDVFTRKDGIQFPAASVCTPLREEGEIVGSVTVFQDITERKRAAVELKLLNEILAQQATSDPLTGIANRLKFNDRLSTEVQRAKRFGTPLSLMMFDIDHFKKINDTHGHLTGDSALRELTSLVAKYVRMHDIFARWGGEEFMIMLANTTAENARLFAEKLRAVIATHKFTTIGHVTCSFGVAQLGLEDTDDRFTRRVDEALYQAKVAGRNRVETV